MMGRLGNDLFQYAMGRILAEQLDFALDCRQEPTPPGRRIAGRALDVGAQAALGDLTRFFPGAPLHMPGRRAGSPVQSFEWMPGVKWNGQTIDLPAVLQDQRRRQIRLRGWFQRYEYYAPHRHSIRQWFRMPSIRVPWRLRPADVLVNIRRGADYGLNNWTMPLSYYEDALTSFPSLGQVYVCGTCIDDNVRAHLAKFRPIYYDADAMHHFRFIQRFDRIVLSNSTFAWWAAFLSDASAIIAPRASHAYAFTGFGDVDLHMRESRYREIAFTESVPFELLKRNPESGKVSLSRKSLNIGDSETIGVDESNRELLSWFVRSKGPIRIREASAYCTEPVFHRTVEECVRAGFLLIAPAHLDEQAGNVS